MINVSNEIYKFNPKNMINRRLKAIVMTFIIVGLFLFLIIVPVFGSTLYNIVKELSGSNTIITVIQEMLVLLKYPIIFLAKYKRFDTKRIPDANKLTRAHNNKCIASHQFSSRLDDSLLYGC